MNGCDPLTLTDDLDSFGCCRYSLNYCISPAHPCLIYWTCVNANNMAIYLVRHPQKDKDICLHGDSNSGPRPRSRKSEKTDALDRSAMIPLPSPFYLCEGLREWFTIMSNIVFSPLSGHSQIM